jgi:hypothetical protein
MDNLKCDIEIHEGNVLLAYFLEQTPAQECMVWLLSRKSRNADRLTDAHSPINIVDPADVKP